jgi:hypothetical protein
VSIKAILFGATGMVGEGVLVEALYDHDVESVLVVGRRSCNVSHSKMREVLHNDFFDYTAIQDQLSGYDACFFCLGVTSLGKSEAEYRHLTYDLTIAAATTLSRLNPGMVFCYVSGLGTDSSEKGKSMWARIKGKTENDLMKLPFKSVYAFRPGFIKPGVGSKNTLWFAKVLAPLYLLLKLVLPNAVCTLHEVGKAMIHVSMYEETRKVLECSDMRELAQANASQRRSSRS